mgnify:CR=1 FL=1
MNQNMTLAERVEQTKLTRTEEKIVEMTSAKRRFLTEPNWQRFAGFLLHW